MSIIDAGTVQRASDALARDVRALIDKHQVEHDWPPELTAQAMLAVAYGCCRAAGMSPDTTLHVASQQFAAVESALRAAKKQTG